MRVLGTQPDFGVGVWTNTSLRNEKTLKHVATLQTCSQTAGAPSRKKLHETFIWE